MFSKTKKLETFYLIFPQAYIYYRQLKKLETIKNLTLKWPSSVKIENRLTDLFDICLANPNIEFIQQDDEITIEEIEIVLNECKVRLRTSSVCPIPLANFFHQIQPSFFCSTITNVFLLIQPAQKSFLLY